MTKTSDTTIVSFRLSKETKRRADQAWRSLGLKSRNQLVTRLIHRCVGFLDPDPELVAVWREHLQQVRGGYNNINQIAKSAKRGTVVWTDDDREDVARLFNEIVAMRDNLDDLIYAAQKNRHPDSAIRRMLRDKNID